MAWALGIGVGWQVGLRGRGQKAHNFMENAQHVFLHIAIIIQYPLPRPFSACLHTVHNVLCALSQHNPTVFHCLFTHLLLSTPYSL